MKKLLLFALLCALSPLGIHAQVTVTGNLKDVGVANVTGSNTYVRFTLSNYAANIPTVTGSNVIVVATKDFHPDTNGNISGTIQGNDTISPIGTYYQVCIYYQGAQFRCATYLITGSAFNLNSAVPLTIVPIAGPNQVVPACFPFLQQTPSSVWTITHNENDPYVFVQATDLSGNQIFPDTLNISDPNTSTLTWVSAQAGRALVCHGVAISIATNQPNAIVTNPVGPQTIVGMQALNLQVPFNVANPGVFSNTQMNEFSSSNLNNFDVTDFVHGLYGFYMTDAVLGAVAVPGTSTVGQANGVTGYCTNLSTATNCVGLFGIGASLASNTRTWSGNVLVYDTAGQTNQNLNGFEMDLNVNSSSSFGSDFNCNGAWTATPLIMDCLAITKPSGGQWTFGIDFAVGATAAPSGSGAAIFFRPEISTAPSVSQGFIFSASNASPGDEIFVQNMDSSGNLTFAYPGHSFTMSQNGVLSIPGSSSGSTSLAAPATGGGLQTFPAGTGTVANINQAQTWSGTQSGMAIAAPAITGNMTYANSVPVANLTLSNHPLAQNCGTAAACSHTALTAANIIMGTVPLVTGTQTVTGFSPGFTSTSTFNCVTNDTTTITNPSKALPASATSITVTGTGTDVISYICSGN